MGLGGAHAVVVGRDVHAVHAKYTRKQPCMGGVLMGAVLTGGHTEHKQGPLSPKSAGKRSKERKRATTNQNEHRETPEAHL